MGEVGCVDAAEEETRTMLLTPAETQEERSAGSGANGETYMNT